MAWSMMNFKGWTKTIFILCTFIQAGCQQDSPPEPLIKKKAVFVYMVADNNLDYYAIHNINEMESGIPENFDGEVYVYIDRAKGKKPAHPYLLKIKKDDTPEVISTILNVYPEQNSCDAQVFKQALSDVERYCAETHYVAGIVLWSHGSAWLPENADIISDRDNPTQQTNAIHSPRFRSFGLDQDDYTDGAENPVSVRREMDIIKLAKELRHKHFDFLIFDACFMASIEVLYEFHSICNYIIASPAEILSTGFPYRELMPLLIQKEFNPQAIVEKYADFYQNKAGIQQSGAVVAVDTKQLQELARLFKQALKTTAPLVNTTQLLQYDRASSEWLFDFLMFAQTSMPQTNFLPIKNQFNKTVLSYRHTNTILSVINLSNSCGVSMYIPHKNPNNKNTNIYDYYKKLQWSIQSGLADWNMDNQ
ncbi:MAG: hypothetical protein H6Q18_173 [Bacteroidetes bacterium]|nr:hypothetical protein [Bacteroidota bacterium]